MHGHVSHVGNSSMEISVTVDTPKEGKDGEFDKALVRACPCTLEPFAAFPPFLLPPRAPPCF